MLGTFDITNIIRLISLGNLVAHNKTENNIIDLLHYHNLIVIIFSNIKHVYNIRIHLL